jgi:hypothetical protein
MRRFLLVTFALAAATLLSVGCTPCGTGKCGKSADIGVSPYCGRYIEGGHGWR